MLVAALVLLIAVVAVRSAAVRALADRAPGTAANLWSSHPTVEIGMAMEEIGRAAARRESPPGRSLAAIAAAARRAPLAAEPFLVRGISAQLDGDSRLAERAFLAARTRAPREPAPRYFLAQHYLTTGRTGDGLREIATLARLVPAGVVSLAPTLADFARTPGAAPQLRALFRSEPQLAQGVLGELAKDPANLELVRSLAELKPGEPAPQWAKVLINRLVVGGQYAKAQQLWSEAAGVRPPANSVFNPRFTEAVPPPPFNWQLESGGVGLAEPASGGALKILFYGREDGPIAQQLLVLAPGSYRLAFTVAGSTARDPGLAWSLTCAPGRQQLLVLPLARTGANGLVEGQFRVPESACAAQNLVLRGTAPDVARQVDVTVSGLSLERSGG